MINCDLELMIDNFKNKKYIHFIGPTTIECNLNILEDIRINYIQKIKN